MADAKIPNADRPAFPTEYTPQMAALRGLTKREAMALVLTAASVASPNRIEYGNRLAVSPADYAKAGTELADALLAALGEPIP